MKFAIAVMVLALVALMSPSAALAAPFNAADTNPQVVAFYPQGPHGIVGENEYHSGIDLVMKRGNSGNFQQWFYGTSTVDGLHGVHSVWNESPDGTCPENWYLVPNPNPAWGDYLTPGVDYCVHNNLFHVQN